MKKLLITLAALITFALPFTALAVTAAPWSITNLTDTFIFPNKINNAVKGIIITASSTIGAGTAKTGLTINGSATTTTLVITGTASNCNGTSALTTNSVGVVGCTAQQQGTITSLTFSAPLTGGTITTNGTVGITQSSTVADGYLSSVNFNIFNNKVSSSSLDLVRDWSVQGNGYLAPTTTRGIIVNASSTIGNGTQAGGLTINGGATTTGNVLIGASATATFGTLEVSNSGDVSAFVISAPQIVNQPGFAVYGASGDGQSGGKAFSIFVSGENFSRTQFSTNGGVGFGPGSAGRDVWLTRSTTNSFLISSNQTVTGTANLAITGTASTTNLTVSSAGGTAGCATFSVNGTISNTGSACGGGGGGTGTLGQNAYFSGTNTVTGTSTLFEDVTTFVGIGSTSPFAKFSIQANSNDNSPSTLFAIGSSTATATTTLFDVTSSGSLDVGSSSIIGFHVINNGINAGNGISLTPTAGAGTNGNGVTLQIVSQSTNDGLSIKAKGGSNVDLYSNGVAVFRVAAQGITMQPGARSINLTPLLTVTGANDSGAALSAGGNAPDVSWDFTHGGNAIQHSNGAIALETSFLIKAANYSFSTYANATNIITDSATEWINSPPQAGLNASTTNAYSLLIGSSTPSLMLNASTTNSYGLTVFAGGGARNNYAATFLGGNVGIGTTSPFSKLSIHALNGETNISLLSVASSTQTATSTLLNLSNTGLFTIGTSTAFQVDPNLTTGLLLGTSTASTGILFDAFSPATTSIRLDSNNATKGSCIVMKDVGGAAYTYITAKAGVLTASTVTCL